jgi:endonuclease/exonuclease/phosphatase (EEP) superfamily protein YafD
MAPAQEGQHNTPATAPPQSPGRRRWLRQCVFAGAVLTLLGAGIATILGFAGRESWRWELLCHFRVQYFGALVLAGAALLVLRRWLLAGAALALSAANLAVIVPLYFGPDVAASSNKPVRILSANVYFLNREFPPLIELIERELPDVVFLMEVTPAWTEALAVIEADYPYRQLMPSHRPDGLALRVAADDRREIGSTAG